MNAGPMEVRMARLNKTWTTESFEVALAAELHKVLEVSHRQAKGLIDARCVKVNGEDAKNYGVRLSPGDSIAVNFDPDRTYPVIPSTKKCMKEDGFIILHEDQHLLFVDKPAGLLTVPAEKGNEPNLAEAITDHYRRRGFKRFQLYIVHRLDRFTSGVLVFAKTPEALYGLKKLFEDHYLQRVYKAILVGELPENSGTLTGKLIEHSKSLRISVVDEKREVKGAKHAITHYRVLERLPGHTVVEVKLETGRRNQIRVQFADRGYPLLGDHVYGEVSPLVDRQALHAELLGFRHPVLEEQVTVQSPLPKDMEAALKALRNVRRVERAEEGITGEEGIYKPKITNGRKLDRVNRAQRYKAVLGTGDEKGSRSGDRRDDRQGGRSGDERPRRDGQRSSEGAPRRDGRPGATSRGASSAAPRGGRPRQEGDERPRSGERKGPKPQGRFEGERSQRPSGGRSERPAGSRAGHSTDSRPQRSSSRSERPAATRSARPSSASSSGAPRSGNTSSRPARPTKAPAGRKPRS